MSFNGRTPRTGPHNNVQVARWEAQKAAERKAWDRVKPRNWDPSEAKLECERAFNRVMEPLFPLDGKTTGYVLFAACYRRDEEVWDFIRRDHCKFEKADGSRVTVKDMREAGWEYSMIIDSVSHYNMAVAEGLITRMFMDMNLPYCSCINQQAGGGVPLSSGPEIDSVRYAVYLVFNKKGIQPFRVRMKVVSGFFDESLRKFQHATDDSHVEKIYKEALSAIFNAHHAFSELVTKHSQKPPQKPPQKRSAWLPSDFSNLQWSRCIKSHTSVSLL